MLKNQRILTLDKTSYFLEDLNRAVEPFHFSVRPYYETSDVMQQSGLVDRGIGVMLCIRQIYEESTSKNVVLVPLEERPFDYNIAFIFQDYDALDAVAKQFIQFIIEHVKRGPESA
jgi:DNA-binding transcriptional LysR family regulator